MAKRKQPFDASRGTVVWAFQQFTEHALDQFLKDLLHAEKTGLSAVESERTQVTLREIRLQAAGVPDHSWFGTSIASELARFERLFVEWCDKPSPLRAQAIRHRRECWDRLVDSRHRMANRFRRNKIKIDEELDLALMRSFYGSFDALAKELPVIFTNLSRAVAAFAKKGGT